jgi:C4-dicarboxylate transporter DctM subunit
VDSGYDRSFSIGLLATAGSLGCMIPPAIAMLVYSIAVQGDASVDPADLFFAGIVPALFIASLLAVYAVMVGLRVPGSRQPFDGGELVRAARAAGWALTLPVLVLGGIYGGLFTPTEAGAVAFAASIAIAVFVHGDVPLGRLPSILAEAATLMGSLILIVVLAFGLNDFLAEVDAPGAIRAWSEGSGLSGWQFLLVVNAILIVLGALMDSISATLVFAPILAPVAIHTYGIDPVHFGIVFVVNMEIGYIAPPVATNLFVASAIFRVPFATVARAVLPTLGVVTGALVVLMYVPVLSLGPLNWRDGRPVWVDFPWDGPVAAEEVPAGSAPAGSAGPGRPMTMEEMMRRARERAAEQPTP